MAQIVRRLWKLPNMTHCNLLSTINSSLPIEIALEKRCAKFIHSCLNGNNLIIKTTSISAITTHRSQFGDIFVKIQDSKIFMVFANWKYITVYSRFHCQICLYFA